MITIVIAIKLWTPQLAGRVIRFSTDNQNAMYAINTGRTNDKFMLHCIREITWWLAKYQILLRATYINTKLNTLPDALSRWYIMVEAQKNIQKSNRK